MYNCVSVTYSGTVYSLYVLSSVPYVQHLFEVQTVSRNYLCGASTHEEMQSWVGILQTLTQYGRKRGNTTCKDADMAIKESDEDELSDKETSMLLFWVH